ncbi:hypothetical protein SprV_0200568100 [Sparganum proliferum]
MSSASSLQEEATFVSTGDSVRAHISSPGSMVCADAGVKVTKDNQFIRLRHRRQEGVQVYVELCFRRILELKQFANEDPMTWAKHDAREWWNSNFGQSIVVSWHLFYRRFRFRDPRFSGPAEVPLKTTLCLTSSTHVSQFNLDIFVRLFGPWHKLYEVWSGLTSHPGFFRGTTFEYAEELLKGFRHLPGRVLISADDDQSAEKRELSGKAHCTTIQGFPESHAHTSKERMAADLERFQKLLNEMLRPSEEIPILKALRLENHSNVTPQTRPRSIKSS